MKTRVSAILLAVALLAVAVAPAGIAQPPKSHHECYFTTTSAVLSVSWDGMRSDTGPWMLDLTACNLIGDTVSLAPTIGTAGEFFHP